MALAIHSWPDGSRYEGCWKYDLQDGWGVKTWANGSKY